MATDASAVLRSFSALMQEGEEVSDAFLLAAIYARAIREDDTPRNIADHLFKALPTGPTWRGQRRALEEMLEREDDPAEAAGEP